MLTPEQLKNICEVCRNARAIFQLENFKDLEREATAALADIDAEIELLKGTS